MKKLYYSISEVSELSGVPAATIRIWENSIVQLTPKRSKGQHRMYTPEMLELVKTIANLRYVHNISLEGVRKQLSSNMTDVEKKREVMERLQALRQELLEIRSEL
ncbi:MAG: MerR family transcriptional regulator [Paludibacteraceae bacterium]|nr:MerR family transcriptional regulator [Paludibacteraceae bacterium]